MIAAGRAFGRSSRQWRSVLSTRPLASGAASSFFEPDPTLFRGEAPEALKEEHVLPRDAQLRTDVRAMGSLLGNIIKEYNGEETFDKVEKLRAFAKVR